MLVPDQITGYKDPKFFELLDEYVATMLLVKYFDESLERLYSPSLKRSRDITVKHPTEAEKNIKNYANKLFEIAYQG